MKELFLLPLSKIIGDDRLKVFKEMGISAKATDFCGWNYGWYTDTTKDKPAATEGDFIKNVVVIGDDEEVTAFPVESTLAGIRPAVKYSDIKDECKNKIDLGNGISLVEYGEYPQKVIGESEYYKLNAELYKGEARFTGKTYSAYVRKGRKAFSGTNFELDEIIRVEDGKKYVIKCSVVYEVEPLTWLVDEENDIAITRDIICSGVKYEPMKFLTQEDIQNWFFTNYNRLGYHYIPYTIVDGKVRLDESMIKEVLDCNGFSLERANMTANNYIKNTLAYDIVPSDVKVDMQCSEKPKVYNK